MAGFSAPFASSAASAAFKVVDSSGQRRRHEREGERVSYTFRPMRWRDLRTIADWRYPGPYAFYNMALAPLVGNMLAQTFLRLVGQIIYHTVLDERGEIAGIFSFLPVGPETIEIGLGMRPELSGQGRGLAFVQAGLDFARERLHPKMFCLTVATFNERARKVYERAGFVPERVAMHTKLGQRHEALEMSREA
jgi:ribosomal-protein-alanine N-acetyltransferase